MAERHSAGRLAEGRHILPLRIYYEDTDATGIVYHGAYLRFMERGRTEMLRALGFSQGRLITGGADHLAFAVRRCEIDFVAPARLDDRIEVDSRLDTLGGASMVIRQAVSCAGKLLARGLFRIACLDQALKPRRLPVDFKQQFATLLPPKTS